MIKKKLTAVLLTTALAVSALSGCGSASESSATAESTASKAESAETGAAGSKILNKGNPNKTGTVYIYFSPTALDDNERFDMMLKWPPKDKLYLRYSEARLNFIKTGCGMDIVGYNIGKLKI